MNRLRYCFFATAIACLFSSSAALSQVVTGTPPLASFGGGPFDTINLSNLNVHLAVPMMNKAGVGLPFTYMVTYDNSIWYPSSSSGQNTWTPVTGWGWNSISDGSTGYVEEVVDSTQCMDQNGHSHPLTYYWFGPYYDPLGTSHPAFVGSTPGQSLCYPAVAPVTGGSSLASDGSGYTLVVSNYTTAAIQSVGGLTINPYIWQGGSYTIPYGSVTDPNGNTISSSYNSSNTTTTFTDTLSTTVLTVDAPAPPGATTLSYTNPSGNTNTPYTIKYTQQIVETNFGCSGVTEYGGTTEEKQYLVSEIDLPDSTKYTFTYEQTPNPNFAGAVTGRLASVTLPTGGEIRYTYTGGSAGITCADGTTATLERYTPDTGSNYWTYAHLESGTSWTTTVTDPTTPTGNVSTYDFQQVSGTQYAYETERQINQGSSTLLLTANTSYNGGAVSLPITQRNVTTTLGSEEAQTHTNYNSYGLVSELDEYNWGLTLVRKTLYAYDYNNSCGVTNTLVVNRACTVQVENSAGTLQAQATYAYDANGNLLTETHTNTGGSPSSVSRSFTHNTNGTISTATDFNSSNHITSYTYASGSTSCNGAFPTRITPPISTLAVSYSYNCAGGVATSVTDPNSQPTTFTYDTTNNFWRVAEIGYADGGQTAISYNDSASGSSVETSRLLSGSTCTGTNCHQITQYLDGLGRVIKTVDGQACNGAGSTVTASYDTLGRVYQVSNPYCTKSDPSYGLTTYGYDALSRVNSITYPDSGATGITYPACTGSTGISASLTDPAGKQRVLCSDALGRITTVTEDPGTPPHLNYQTAYAYDVLNDLTGVAQGSSQTRTYAYDMLGHLTSAKVPEFNSSGTQCSTTYGYDANGNLTSRTAPLENQTGCSSTVTTTYAYDALNRLTSKTYNDTPATPPANYFYDQAPSSWPAWSGVSFSNAKGRLVLACTNSAAGTCASPATATAYSYDPVGRTNSFWQCNPSNCGGSSIWNTQYNYDLAGDIDWWSFPGYTGSTVTLTNSVNSAQQVTAVQSSWQDTTHPQYLAENVAYTPWGAVSQLENGCAGSGCTNTQETYTYNNRLQPWMIQLGTSSSSSADYCLVYNYFSTWTPPSSCPTPGSVPTSGSGNNGNVMGYWYQDSVQSALSHTATYGYDALNRLITAVATGSSTYNLTFNYDAYGNMTCTTNGQTQGYCPNWAYNTSTNQLTTSGFTYDAAGNLTKDSSNATAHTYQWDAEGRVASVDSGSTWAFTYNAVGNRVQWAYSGGTDEHLFDPAGNWLGNAGEYSAVWRGNVALAVYIWGDTLFNHANHLGSTTLRTNQAGTPIEDILFYPWGYVWQLWGSGGFNFAELPYTDLTTVTELTPARVFSPNLGRWHSPDPMWPVAVRLDDPQTWNMYAYVRNNPTGLVDPSGAEYCKVVTDSQGNQSIDTTSCVSDADYGNEPAQYPGYVQVSQDVTITVTANPDTDPAFGADQGSSGLGFGTPLTPPNNASPDPTLDQRANDLARAINKTGVQTLASPCTIGLFYGASRGAAALVTVDWTAVVVAAEAHGIPASAILATIFGVSPERLAAFLARSLPGAASAVQTACSQ